jgi:hypothetical protein
MAIRTGYLSNAFYVANRDWQSQLRESNQRSSEEVVGRTRVCVSSRKGRISLNLSRRSQGNPIICRRSASRQTFTVPSV